MEMVRISKKNPKNKICSQMYEVFDLNEAYVDYGGVICVF
jgi:hypothetical protein